MAKSYPPRIWAETAERLRRTGAYQTLSAAAAAERRPIRTETLTITQPVDAYSGVDRVYSRHQ